MKTIIEMAREANVYCTTRQPTLDAMLERFAELVRADERELVLAAAIDGAEHAARKAVADEREACAKVCEKVAVDMFTQLGREHEQYMKATAEDCAMQIRARGQSHKGTSMTQTEALKLALEALENLEHSNFKRRRLDALIAIKQASAQTTTQGEEHMTEEDDDTQVYKKPWIGLTDNERDTLYNKHSLDSPSILIKAVEQALKEKNT